jgi:hypothetical protein
MIDPDGIQIQRVSLPDTFDINQVPEFENEIYNLEDETDYKHYIKDVEGQIRRSFEYKQFIKYLRDNFGMNKCAFLKGVTNEETFDIKIEIHHYPFSLHDIVEIVLKKRRYYNESLDVQMVAKEAMILHYKIMIGLIPLSETVHELAHSSRLFIPSDTVFGRYNLFVDYYKPFIEPEMLDALERIEKYTREHSELLDTTIIDENTVRYNIKDNEYRLPNMDTVANTMLTQIEYIKNNNYLLPSPSEIAEIDQKIKTPVKAISFF